MNAIILIVAYMVIGVVVTSIYHAWVGTDVDESDAVFALGLGIVNLAAVR